MVAPSVDVLGISDYMMTIFTWVVMGVGCQLINIFGIVTNIINIICFVKQGFEESMNITLLGLSVSDLGSLSSMVVSCIFFTPALMTADLSFEPLEVVYLTSAMVHFSFTRISSCITAMITLERCLCITAPLKIKSLITPKRTTVITMGAFIIFLFSGAPVYFVNRLDWKFSPLRNKTIVGLVSTENKENVEKISFAINNFSLPFAALVIITVCTTILSFQLRRQTKWRQKTITSAQIDKVSSRSQKAAKMVVMISTLFIACFVPVTIIVLVVAFLPELSVNGKLVNLTFMILSIGYILESVNSSMNIFIYYQMSSKYRETLCKLFLNNSCDNVS